MSEIKLKKLTFSFNPKKDSVPVLKEVNATFFDKKINVIVGESGCGKSTLLRCIAGLYRYQGEILFDDLSVDHLETQQRDVAYVNQNYALYPHYKIFDSISFPLRVAHCPIKEVRERVYEVADELQIRHLLNYKPSELSGGEKQRACLARALVKRADIILFDEPLSNVDESSRFNYRHFIRKTIEKYGSTAVYVTHDLKEALLLGDYINIMENGKIVYSGTTLEAQRSKNKKVKEFFIKHEN